MPYAQAIQTKQVCSKDALVSAYDASYRSYNLSEMSTPLALELYHLIIQHVHDQADLRALALCCSAFRDEAQRYLFRDIVPVSYDQRTKLISTINGAPLRFGRLVHKLQIRDGLVSNPDDPLVSKPLSLALHAMYNLKHLELYLWRPSTVLQRCTFSLRILVWHAMNGPEVSFLLRNFLPTQNHIKSLEIIHWEEFDAMEVPTNLCPDLDSLGVNDSRLVSILLPEARLISHFQWHGIYTPGTLTIRQLNHLESFKFYIAHSDSNTSFTQHMTSLIYLELEINVGSPPNLLPKVSSSTESLLV